MDKQAYMKMMTGGLVKTAGPRSAGRRFPGLKNKNLRVLGRQAYNRSVSLPVALNVAANKRKYNKAVSKIIGKRNVLKRLSRD